MYQSKFVAVIKVAGRVLREDHGVVAIPFGAEYSVLLKNLNSVRVMAKLSIDGQDATEGTWLVLGPNSNTEIERFIHNANLQAGNRFKFIERTGEIEAHRGIGAEDGLVRIEFKTERVWTPPPPFYNHPRTWPGSDRCRTIGSSASQQSYHSNTVTSTAGGAMLGAAICNVAPAPTAGITVEGSVSHQQFSWTDSFPVEEPGEVMVLRLVGEIAGAPVTRPVTVEVKPKCTTCGRVNKATSKFCSNCGTSLTII